MPIYEYHCETCQDDFEVLVRTSADRDHVACPSCESGQVTKKFSAFATTTTADQGAIGSPAAMSRGCGPACGCHI